MPVYNPVEIKTEAWDPASVIGKNINDCPHVVYGQYANQILNKVNDKIFAIWSNEAFLEENKLIEIMREVSELQQPIVHLLEQREKLRLEVQGNPI